jgi:hypothetical protein
MVVEVVDSNSVVVVGDKVVVVVSGTVGIGVGSDVSAKHYSLDL